MRVLVAESNQQFLAAWTFLARGAANPLIQEFDGVVAMFSRVPVSFLNVVGLASPAHDLADLERRLQAMKDFAGSQGFPWFTSICKDWIPPGAEPVLEAAGLRPFMKWTGMFADALTPPHRAVGGLVIRPVTTAEERIAVNDLNSVCYDIPAEPGRGPMSREELWRGMFGSLGYIGGVPVAGAATIPLQGRLYVAFVATLPQWRRLGFAEACMRDSLARASAASGFQRTVLHATDAGHPVYLKMGYQAATEFTLYEQEL